MVTKINYNDCEHAADHTHPDERCAAVTNALHCQFESDSRKEYLQDVVASDDPKADEAVEALLPQEETDHESTPEIIEP